MTKTDLNDITFLILIRLDSLDRLENILAVTDYLCRYFDTHIFVVEAARMNNGILKSLLKKNIRYEFIEDKDPVLYKTKYFNAMTREVATPLIAIWDADVICEKKYIEDAVAHLRESKADVVLPYNGQCLNTSLILRELFLKKRDVRILNRNKDKMDLLHNRPLVGGAVMVNKEKYIYAGMESEKYYGWGDDDFDRYRRFSNLNFNIYRTENCLYHLSHARNQNSGFNSMLNKSISKRELHKITNSSMDEILSNN